MLIRTRHPPSNSYAKSKLPSVSNIVICFGVLFSAMVSGPVALMATLATIVIGYFGEFIGKIASGELQGGGPLESAYRMVTHDNMVTELEAGVFLTALLIVSVLGLWRQGRTPIKADFRSATEYVAARRSSHDLLLFQIPYGRHSFDYYLSRYREPPLHAEPDDGADPRQSLSHRIYLPLLARHGGAPYRWAEGLYTNGGMDPAIADASMKTLTTETGTVWLIAMAETSTGSTIAVFAVGRPQA